MISHLELNVSDLQKSLQFYLCVLGPLGFQRADGNEDYVRISNGRDTVLTLCPVSRAFQGRPYHRRALGLSHFALAVDSAKMVDEIEVHLARLGIPLLGEGKVELGYRGGYYTLAFEDPDRVMIEIVYHPPTYFSHLPP